MSEFAYLFRGGTPSTSPQEMQKQLENWMAWAKELTDKGHLKARGPRLERPARMVTKGAINDGPFTEAKDIVGGLMVIEADDIDHAAKLAQGCPLLDVGGQVEVRPVLKA